jgi:hypothetical protein
VSHLEFADDTLLLGVKSWANVKVMCAMLVLFELMSGLKVNFHKSICWLGLIYQIIGYTRSRSALHCKMGKIHFLYLGLPIGGASRRRGFWEPVLSRIRNRLSGWKSRFFVFWWPSCSYLIYLDISTCLCPFLLQSSLKLIL